MPEYLMSGRIRIIDHFLAQPQMRRDRALRSTFRDEVATGAVFPGIGRITEELDAPRLRLECPWMSEMQTFFRLSLKGVEQPTYIHNDNAMGTVTGILYLNPERACRGGTLFWRHKATRATDTTRLTAPEVETCVADSKLVSKWERVASVEMKFNRLVLFDSDLWHSPYGRRGFGDSPESGRLVQVYFIR